ncbi:hypothetical protein [Oscillatoria sp. CS-180]|uniref:hypothetical protein n=1 Tax=Oscillatoria sp. CS-180 TaxID=3021720 RepID=UPI00232B9B77|nr:hypothetical protein [Oscillatoria sp. CS-180]
MIFVKPGQAKRIGAALEDLGSREGNVCDQLCVMAIATAAIKLMRRQHAKRGIRRSSQNTV